MGTGVRKMMILLIHNEPLVGAGLRAILANEPDIKVVGEESDYSSVASACRTLSPDVAVVSAKKRSEDGSEAISAIRNCRNVAVLVMGEDEDGEAAREALAAGARGYLPRGASTDLIVQTLKTISNGGVVVPDRLRRDLFAQPASDVDMQTLRKMTPREHAILGHLAQGKSNTEIASEMFLAEATVKKHVSRILHKFKLNNRLQAGLFAYRLGLASPDCNAGSVAPPQTPR
jgi:DNA-binding NarL/FixJ family response regulator